MLKPSGGVLKKIMSPAAMKSSSVKTFPGKEKKSVLTKKGK